MLSSAISLLDFANNCPLVFSSSTYTTHLDLQITVNKLSNVTNMDDMMSLLPPDVTMSDN